MPLFFEQTDITGLAADAIVNAANPFLSGGGGVDGAIHRAAGPRLSEACRALHGCPTGQAKLTPGFDLPAKYVIHTVGPVWRGGGFGEEKLLSDCYRHSLALAAEHGCLTVAFPLISAGAYGYPSAEVLRVAVQAISAFLAECDADLTVILTVLDPAPFRRGPLFQTLSARLAETRSARPPKAGAFRSSSPPFSGSAPSPAQNFPLLSAEEQAPELFAPNRVDRLDLKEQLDRLDESFSEMLLRRIDEQGLSDAACYKRANLDRKLFSKIRSDRAYHPSRQTALALAVALRLTLPETEALLRTAGYALSRSDPFDVIVETHIRAGDYDVHRINQSLFAFGQKLLGSC